MKQLSPRGDYARILNVLHEAQKWHEESKGTVVGGIRYFSNDEWSQLSRHLRLDYIQKSTVIVKNKKNFLTGDEWEYIQAKTSNSISYNSKLSQLGIDQRSVHQLCGKIISVMLFYILIHLLQILCAVLTWRMVILTD